MSGYHYQISEASRLLAVEAHVLRYWEEELGMIIPRNEMGHRYYTEDHLRIFSQIKDMKERGYQLRAIRAILSGEESPETAFHHYPSEGKGDGSCPVTEIPVKKDSVDKNRMDTIVHSPEIPVQAVKGNMSKVYPISAEDDGGTGGEKTGAYRAEIAGEEHKMADTEYMEGNFMADHSVEIQSSAEIEDSPDEKMKKFQAVMTHIVAQAMLCNNSGLAREISQKVEGYLLPEIEALMKLAENRQEERFRKLDESMRTIQQSNRARYEAAASKSPFLFGRKKKKRNMRRI